MSTDGKEKKAIVKRDGGGATESRKAKHASGKSSVVITGGKPSRFNRYSVVPTDEKLKKLEEKRRERERADIEWERGVIRTKSGVDRLLLVLILLLTVIGLIALFSASYPLSIYESSRKDGAEITGTAYIQRQLMFTGIGFAVMFLISRIPYNFYRNYGILFYGAVLVLLVLAIFIGHGGTESATASGVRRWIGIQGTPYNIQPSELMKSALVMMLAKHYENNREATLDYDDKRTSYLRGVAVPLLIVGVSALAVAAGSHLSGMIVVGFIGFCVMITAGAHIWKTILTVMAVGIPAGLVFLIAKPYALARITTFFSSEPDVLGADWQTTQGMYALGSGGLLGKGFGNSTQKFSYVSDAHTDFIFTIWGEEMGFIGSLFVIGIFALLVYRGITVAKNAPDVFSSLLAFGIIFKIGLQVLLNIAVVTDSLPNTGIPMPFFSYGGSSCIVLMAELGILLSISRHSYQKRM